MSEPLPSGRRGLSPELVTSSQRTRILDSVADACAAKGYPHVTVADIVSGARVSRSTFYEHFKDKEACFLAAFDGVLSRFLSDLIRACEQEGMSWSERVGAGLEVMLEFFDREPAFARMCIVDMLYAGPRALERYRAAVRVITTYVDAGRHELPGRERLPTSTAAAIVGGGELLIRDEILSGRAGRLGELREDLLYSALAPYLGQEVALREVARSSPDLVNGSGGSAAAPGREQAKQ